ncbi:Peptidase M1, membrane alanine aminopeptidase, N-terminal [Syntrophomonas zehnderi OL-4]|uniref:Peptidase M1, membrane alanine aminopeptidase, N-terminal n=1 Tax=Syntrophomonas zehnderi OL-4 TaxID=690567 RepID=A0A0E4G906_9FIRM|nr:M1 family metallopeptidase [Syntrophomonas zehnderi]CFX02087.1 Peptidase M1, membrane alanine aminopeptidase, N-terminal [Syntrophomonas zehnderi OL-4]
MHKNNFYMLIIVVAVLCASAFFYFDQKVIGQAPLAALQKKETNGGKKPPLFPSPEKTIYKMQLYLDTENHTLHGSTLLTTQNTSGRDLSELWFTVYPNCFRDSRHSPAPTSAYYAGFNEGWLEIDSLRVNGSPAQYSGRGACLRVKPAALILSDGDLKIEMTWRVKIPRVKYRFGSKDTTYMLGNFYPALNVLGTSGWHNAYNADFGDPFCFHTADYQVVLNIPSGYNFVSTGKTVDAQSEDNGREIYLVQAENARDFCLLVMYDYTKIEEKIKGITVQCYYPGTNHQVAKQTLRQSARILNYYACQFGSYPYETFKTVFVPMQGFHGMEYSGVIFLQEDLLKSGTDKSNQFILAHEIAHQWWYGMVGNDQLREPWLDEGLANWSAYQYLHAVEGQAWPDLICPQDMDLGKQLAQMNSREDYYLTAYRGGEAFWFGLEEEIGHEIVIKILRRYLAEFKNDIASSQDLIRIIKNEAGQNIDEYINKWFSPANT